MSENAIKLRNEWTAPIKWQQMNDETSDCVAQCWLTDFKLRTPRAASGISWLPAWSPPGPTRMNGMRSNQSDAAGGERSKSRSLCAHFLWNVIGSSAAPGQRFLPPGRPPLTFFIHSLPKVPIWMFSAKNAHQSRCQWNDPQSSP